MCCLEATQLTLESVHAAQVDLGNRECAHVARKNKLATAKQVLLLDTRKPLDHQRCDLTYVVENEGRMRQSVIALLPWGNTCVLDKIKNS